MALTSENNTRISSVYPSISGGIQTNSAQIILGRVLSVELNDPAKLGQITYESLTGGNAPIAPALPTSTNIRHIPVVDEIVAIITGPSFKLNDLSTATQAYYFPPFALWNNSHVNKFPKLSKLQTQQANKLPSAEEINLGIPINSTSPTTPQPSSEDIEETDTSNTLRSFSGDVIVEGRWGHAIRFGSTGIPGSNPWSQAGTKKSPILIMTNGYKKTGPENWSFAEEDINSDDCSIWMTSTQEITINDIENNFSIESFKSQTGLNKTSVTTIPTLPASYTITSRAEQDRKNNR